MECNKGTQLLDIGQMFEGLNPICLMNNPFTNLLFLCTVILPLKDTLISVFMCVKNFRYFLLEYGR